MRLLTRERRVDYVHRLRTLDIYGLGRGFNSHVFQHPVIESCAVKVVDTKDKVYFDFLDWVKENQHNPYAPQIYDVMFVDVIGDTQSYAIVFMEKLDRIGMKEYNSFLETMGFKNDGIQFLSELDVMSARDYAVDDMDLHALLTYLLTKPFSLDLHQGNFMKRGDQVVFSDPFAGGGGF